MKDLKQYFRIDEECYNKPFEIVIPYQMKRNTVMGKSISTNEKNGNCTLLFDNWNEFHTPTI